MDLIARDIRTNIVIGGRINSSLRGSFSSAANQASKLAKKVAAVGAAVGAASVGKTMIDQASSMQTYRNTLNVVMKDQKKAADTFKWATDFANKTPFETDEVVQGAVKLQSYGLVAKDVMTNIGDMSAVMGKSLDQGVEAIADAQAGELERLKEFGITKQQIVDHAAKIMKGKQIVNNKGQITDQANFNKALFSLMEERYKGGMELQSKTFKGAMSTVSGVWKNSLAQIAGISATGDVIEGSLFDKMTKSAINAGNVLQNFANSGVFTKISATLGKGLTLVSNSISKITKPFSSFFNMLLKGNSISHAFWMSFQNVLGKDIAGTVSGVIGYIEFGIKGLIAFLKGDFTKAGDMFYNMFPDESETNGKVNKIISFLQSGMNTIRNIGITMKTVGKSIFTTVGTTIKNILPYVKQFIMTMISINTKIAPVISRMVQTIGSAISKIIPIIGQIIQFVITKVVPILSNLVNFIATYIIPVIVNTINAVVPRIISIIQNLWAFIQPILSGIMSFIGFMMPFIQQIVLAAISTISGVIRSIAQVLDGIIGFISGVFTGNWSAAWQGVVDIFGGIFNTLGSILKAPLNVVIGLINGAISNINKISFDVPKWVPKALGGGKKFGVNIPQIPMLAKGGITRGTSIAGEDGPEAVIPLKRKNPRSLSLLNKTAEKLGVSYGKNSGGNTYIYAPNIQAASTPELKQVLQDQYEQFKEFIEKYENEKGRLAYE